MTSAYAALADPEASAYAALPDAEDEEVREEEESEEVP
jgi:hypothetical protein